MTVDSIGGVWTYALELARALEPYGIEIAFASMGGRLSREQYDQVVTRKNVRLFESAYRLEWMDDPWGDVDRAGDWLLQIAARVRPDIIHLNGYSHAVLPWNAPVLVVAHSCVLSWWRAVKQGDAPSRYDQYRARVAAGLAAANLIVAPSVAMRDALAADYGANFNRRSWRLPVPGAIKGCGSQCALSWKNYACRDCAAIGAHCYFRFACPLRAIRFIRAGSGIKLLRIGSRRHPEFSGNMAWLGHFRAVR